MVQQIVQQVTENITAELDKMKSEMDKKTAKTVHVSTAAALGQKYEMDFPMRHYSEFQELELKIQSDSKFKADMVS